MDIGSFLYGVIVGWATITGAGVLIVYLYENKKWIFKKHGH